MKRKISFILVLAIALTIPFSVFSADTSDVSESVYYKDIDEIKAIGIMTGDEKGNFNPFESLTRAEFAKIICYIDTGSQGYEAVGAESPFYDVNPEHWAFGYIGYAVTRGFMNGYTDGSFKPDECITLIEAAKVLVALTGHEYKAVAEGGYPSGYQITAKSLGILNGITAAINDYLYREEIACLINNTLDVVCLKESAIKEGGTIYTTDSNETLLMTKFKMRRLKERVLATDIASIGVNNILADNLINVGGVIIKTDIKGSRDYLGFYVRCIYSCQNDENTLVSIQNNNTDILKVDAEDYSSYVNNRFSYEVNDDTKSFTISRNADFILNGDNVSYYDDIFDINLGYYTFIKSKDSNVYDLVIIKSYTVINAYSIDKDRRIISDKYNYAVKLDMSDEEKIYNIEDYDGNEIEFASIKKGDIITVAKGNSIYEIYSDSVTAEGFVSSCAEDEIEVAPDVYKRNYYSLSNNYVSPGKSYKLYLDYFGNVSDTDALADTASVYYLVTAKEKRTAVTYELHAKFYTLDNKFVSYQFAENVVVDGKYIKAVNETKLASEISDTAVISGSICQPVSIEVNDGKISKLTTAKARDELIAKGEDGLCLRYEEKSRAFYTESKTYGWEVYVEKTTPFMIVPPDSSVTDEDSFKITTYTDFDTTTTLAGYTFTKDNVVSDFVLVKKNTSTIANEFEGHDILAVVDKVSTVMNEEGEQVKKMHILKGTYGGDTEMDLYFDENSTLTDENGYSIHDIVAGDAVKIRWNEDNEIQVFLVYYKSNLTGKKYVYTGQEEGSFTTIAQRKVTDVISGYMFADSLDGEKNELFDLSKFTIIVVKSNGVASIIEKGTPDDIFIDDYVIYHIISRSPKTLIIYK